MNYGDERKEISIGNLPSHDDGVERRLCWLEVFRVVRTGGGKWFDVVAQLRKLRALEWC